MIVLVINLVSIRNSCSAQALELPNDHGVVQMQQKSQLHHHDCLLWFYFNSETAVCQCFSYYGVSCFGQNATLQLGFCATYDAEAGLVALSHCPYFQSHHYKLFQSQYILLPQNISLLNDHMCKPMNRDGMVCGKCMDGYGPTGIPVGVQMPCAECTNTLYGVMLYLLIEFVPITALYFLLLMFRISVTSAPMTCFIMYSQLTVMAFDRIYAGGDICISPELLSLSPRSELLLNLILSLLDVWNLRFFHYFVPPFCISSYLKPIHITVLGYVSAFYPICLVFITWFCIELHGHNCRPLVLLWRPFHRCFVRIRRGWDTNRDIIDVFASFFLLSFSRLMYQGLLLMTPQAVYTYLITGEFVREEFMLSIDLGIKFASTQHLIFAVPSIFVFLIFCVLPTILLIIYPFKVIRRCLARCKLDTIALKIFVEKYQGCYKDALDGGRDMRSLSGLYFFVRVLVIVVYGVSNILQWSNNDPWLPRSILVLITCLIVSLLRPYKKTYMNVLDILLLTHLAIACHLFSSCCAFSNHFRYVTSIIVVLAIPLAGFFIVGVFVACHKLNAKKLVVTKLKQHCSVCCRLLMSTLMSTDHPTSDQQQLLDSAVMGNADYGTYT